MSREKQLVKNTLIYMIGNFASKFLGFLLLPLYTHYLAKGNFGNYDVIQVTITIIIPLITLQINDSLYRYILDSQSVEESERIITNSFFVTITGLAAFSIAFIIYVQFSTLTSPYLILGYVIVLVIQGLWQQITRGLKKNVIYSIAGVIYTAVMLVSNVLLLVVFKMQVEALFYSNIAASLAVIVYIEIKLRIFGYIKKKYFEPAFIKELIKYSAPLLPNAINWWVISACSRYAIKYFVGPEANDIFAVAVKFPNIILAFNSIFYLAWQESAIQEHQSEDRNRFYTDMFNLYMKFQFGLVILMIPVTRWLMLLMAKGGTYVAWKYVPLLYIGTAFQAFATFYGTGYLSSKDTKGAFITSVAGAVINLVFNLALTPFIGIQAASVSNMLAFGGMWLWRLIQTKKYFSITIDKKSFFVLLGASALYSGLYYFNSIIVDIIMLAAAIPLVYMSNRELAGKFISYAGMMLNKVKTAVK